MKDLYKEEKSYGIENYFAASSLSPNDINFRKVEQVSIIQEDIVTASRLND